MVAKDLGLANVSLGEFLTSKFCLAIDLKSSDDDRLHGSGRRIEDDGSGISIHITKEVEPAGTLNAYIFTVLDALLNLENGDHVNTEFSP